MANALKAGFPCLTGNQCSASTQVACKQVTLLSLSLSLSSCQLKQRERPSLFSHRLDSLCDQATPLVSVTMTLRIAGAIHHPCLCGSHSFHLATGQSLNRWTVLTGLERAMQKTLAVMPGRLFCINQQRVCLFNLDCLSSLIVAKTQLPRDLQIARAKWLDFSSSSSSSGRSNPWKQRELHSACVTPTKKITTMPRKYACKTAP